MRQHGDDNEIAMFTLHLEMKNIYDFFLTLV